MLFKRTTIPPEGRNKYGNYISTGNITKSIVSYNNGGNGTATGGTPSTPSTGTTEPQKNYALVLGKTQGNFEWNDIVANSGQTDTIQVLGYGDLVMVPTFVGDISIRPIEYNADGTPKLDANGNEILDETNVPSNRNWDIKGIPESGVSVTVKNNGTSATTVEIKIDTNINTNQASLYIPCSVYTGDDDKAPWADNYNEDGGLIETEVDDYSDWSTSDNTRTLWLEYNLSVLMNATNSYTLDLTNEIAGVNWNNDGTMMEGATLPTCQAKLYFGETLVEGATYGISPFPETKQVQGVSINTSTGEITFGNNFSFIGTMLEISVYATDKSFTATKIMTVNKIYPGKDGAGAVNRWLVPSVDAVTYNPNSHTTSVNTISVKVMKQVNTEEPIEDTEVPIYYGWDTENPLATYSEPISVQSGREYLCFALKNSDNVIYERETIPIVDEGTNGDIGESVYTLILTNENTAINCDSNGNILEGAERPECDAYLYYGKDLLTGATYTISGNATGISMDGNSVAYADNFSLGADVVQLTISAYVSGKLILTKIMTITKNIPGKDGKDGINGQNGQDGQPGKNGVGISATTIRYGLSSSQNTQPTTWSEQVPTLVKGQYLWTKTTWTYTDNTTEVGYQKTYISKDGNNGNDGLPGKDGVGISATIIEYGISAKEDTQPTTWSEQVPTLIEGQYLWTKTTWYYTDNTTETGYQKTYISKDGADGADGLPGKDGVGISATSILYGISASEDTQPTTWSEQVPTLIEGQYLWTKTTWYYTDNTTEVAYQKTYISKDGISGQSAISYWLKLDTYYFIVNKEKEPNVNKIFVSAHRQVGQGLVESLIIDNNNVTVKYGINTTSPSLFYTNGIPYDENANYYTVVLLIDNIERDRQTIPVVKDGENGSNGSDGRQGPTIRGPFDYVNMTPVDGWRWCNGELTSSVYTDDAKFIDIIMVDDKYYRCKTSYNSDSRDWEPDNIDMILSSYWQISDATYDFVATNLLMVENAKINFASTNELLLLDNEGIVTAGAAGTTSANTVNFWAGASDPVNAKFKVDNTGVMIATKGKFGCMEIVDNTYFNQESELIGSYTEDEGNGNVRLNPYLLEFYSNDSGSYTRISGQDNADLGTPDGAHIDINVVNTKTAIHTNGAIEAKNFIANEYYEGKQLNALMTPFNNLKVVIICDDSSKFTNVNGKAYFNGSPLGDTYFYTTPYIGSNGYWYIGNNTGIASSSVVKEGNVIYIQI